MYIRFLLEFGRFLVDHAVQAAILVLFFALIYGQIGQGLGLPLLFWSEEPSTRWSVAVCSTLLLAVIGLNGYYLLDDEHFVAVMKKVLDFLGEPYSQPAGNPNAMPQRPEHRKTERPLRSQAYRLLKRIPGIIFLDHTPLDPRLPDFGSDYSNPYLLSRFLRLVRLPFLVLLALPAILPRFFVNLPRFAPIVQNIQERKFFGNENKFLGLDSLTWIERPDVATSSHAYWFALAIWLFGIWCGVMVVKIFLRLSDVWSSGQRNRLRSIVFYAISATIVFSVMALPPIYDGRHIRENLPLFTEFQGIAPGVAILALMGLVALMAALVGLIFEGSWRRVRPVAVALVVAVVAWMNSAWDSFRFENLDYSSRPDLKATIEENYPKNANTEDPVTAQGGEPLVLDKEALDAWKKECQGGTDSASKLPKLVVVCTSGGAIRAGYWTATVLDRLGSVVGREAGTKNGPFHKHVRIITGASGGMVGASYYVTWLLHRLGDKPIPESKPLPAEGWVQKMPIFSLAPIARSIALRDPLFTATRRLLNLFGSYPDRGQVLDQDWVALGYPVSAIRTREKEGKVPSLIFSPMTIEDGRRLFISNLDLTTLYNPDPSLKDCDPPPPPLPATRRLPANMSSVIGPQGDPSSLTRVSISGVEFFKTFRPTDKNNILLATAARMSASFPYVSPAVNLPSNPPLRVVDAGYYDNYGVDIAAAWIFANRFWIEQNTSGVLVVQIRDSLSESDRVGYPVEDNSDYARLLRGLQFFFSPIEGAARARYSSASFRNDALISGLSDYFSQRRLDRSFFTTAIFELSSRTVRPVKGLQREWPGDSLDDHIRYADSSQATEVAMSWYLTVAERQAVDMAIPTPQQAEPGTAPVGVGTRAANLANVLKLPNTPRLEIEALDQKALEDPDPTKRKNRIDQLTKLAEFIRSEMHDDLALRERALLVIEKETARASNYEVLREVHNWWQRP